MQQARNVWYRTFLLIASPEGAELFRLISPWPGTQQTRSSARLKIAAEQQDGTFLALWICQLFLYQPPHLGRVSRSEPARISNARIRFQEQVARERL